MKLSLAGSLLVLTLLAGCGSGSLFGGEDEVPIEDRSATEIFAQAEAEMAEGNYEEAAETFDEVERLFPFSQLAKRAMMMSAFASYQGGDMPSARASANRFLDLYPSDADAPYAQYLIALTWYDNIVDVGRDQATTQNALQELQELVRRYPESDFARDAELKIDLTRNHLAGKEMTVGRYYLKRGHYTAAINRFREVLEEYQTTSHTPEALHRLVEAYLALGLEREAQVVAAVLGENFVGSDWYARSYALLTDRHLLPASRDDSFFDTVYRRVILGEWL
ncbi:MAG TPA: outer membrane protein assembly factor BamD [Paracoccaceae bacterium]|nr:outer membrane protein assembly factor BamD [Paracoccaceae bacterium]